MKKSILFILFLLFVISSIYAQKIKPGSKIIVNNSKIHQIISENATIEILAEGFEWTEGPLWLEQEQKLIFSDIPQNSIFEWTEKNGIQLYLKPSGYTGRIQRTGEIGSNGLLLNNKNELVLCQHGDRRIAKMDASINHPEAKFTTITSEYEGKMLNSPNDGVYSKNGILYFTDPPYGLEKLTEDPSKELEFQGVYKTEKNGKTILLTKELSRPNGIGFSPDGTKLYVANSDSLNAIWMVYDLAENGQLQNGKILFNATHKTSTLKGLPDGLKVHKNGWIFATGPGGVLIFTPKGEHLGTIYTGEATANCAFNTNYSELFITADDYLLRVKLNVE